MTGLCRSQCCLDGFLIAHLTNQNNIRCLTERCAKPRHVAFGIQADFSLGNDTLIMTMQILDRILQRDHMGIACLVDLVNDAGQCGTLTTARRSGYQNKPLGHAGNIDHHLRNMQVMEVRQIECDHTNDSRQGTSLTEYIDTETRNARKCHCKVIVAAFHDMIHAAVICQCVDFTHHLFNFLREDFFVRLIDNLSAHLPGKRHAWDQEYICRALFYCIAQYIFCKHRHSLQF